ncbi:hypothetical protein CYMTET_11598 [Cymbomonas tetramitiformis]|uniref:Uncharacterized protein n=1 Tax=Cymbomonas tetramitiformis TaxID=36881 RepID=A0AAE0C7S8_9CHLO|nr:hypothetical protein CYMTET_40629 [Cymbomonas tetramitiformis]KAK3280566.1 hypothetical protein CYMTET_11598 [Cymbomonas tetramitiformis]
MIDSAGAEVHRRQSELLELGTNHACDNLPPLADAIHSKDRRRSIFGIQEHTQRSRQIAAGRTTERRYIGSVDVGDIVNLIWNAREEAEHSEENETEEVKKKRNMWKKIKLLGSAPARAASGLMGTKHAPNKKDPDEQAKKVLKLSPTSTSPPRIVASEHGSAPISPSIQARLDMLSSHDSCNFTTSDTSAGTENVPILKPKPESRRKPEKEAKPDIPKLELQSEVPEPRPEPEKEAKPDISKFELQSEIPEPRPEPEKEAKPDIFKLQIQPGKPGHMHLIREEGKGLAPTNIEEGKGLAHALCKESGLSNRQLDTSRSSRRDTTECQHARCLDNGVACGPECCAPSDDCLCEEGCKHGPRVVGWTPASPQAIGCTLVGPQMIGWTAAGPRVIGWMPLGIRGVYGKKRDMWAKLLCAGFGMCVRFSCASQKISGSVPAEDPSAYAVETSRQEDARRDDDLRYSWREWHLEKDMDGIMGLYSRLPSGSWELMQSPLGCSAWQSVLESGSLSSMHGWSTGIAWSKSQDDLLHESLKVRGLKLTPRYLLDRPALEGSHLSSSAGAPPLLRDAKQSRHDTMHVQCTSIEFTPPTQESGSLSSMRGWSTGIAWSKSQDDILHESLKVLGLKLTPRYLLDRPALEGSHLSSSAGAPPLLRDAKQSRHDTMHVQCTSIEFTPPTQVRLLLHTS